MTRWLLPLALVAASLSIPHGATACLTQPVHTYVSGASIGLDGFAVSVGEGHVVVADTNVADCNADRLVGDFDGDYDAGVGGAFFGGGPWANEGTCDYDLNEHVGDIRIADAVFGSGVAFRVGVDDAAGPTILHSAASSA